MGFEIEKGVEIPSNRNEFSFGKMEVGDSFLVPDGLRKKTAGAAYAFGRAHNLKFSVRRVEGGCRCWRVL